MLRKLFLKLEHLLGKHPQNCLLCHQASPSLICTVCYQDLQLFSPTDNLMLNPEIYKALNSCSFPILKALAPYQWPLNQLVTQLKFNNRLLNATALAELFYQQVLRHTQKQPQVLIPVPLHKKRYFERHYNQALLLAKHLAKRTNIKLDTNFCFRSINTRPQTSITAAQRRKNLHQAFRVNAHCQYQHLAIVDDVITTGATADSLYQCLRQSLPQAQIEVWTMCISLPHR